MRSDTRINARFDLTATLPARRIAWAPLLLAVALGAVEWAALARSQAADRLAALLKRR